MPAQSYMLYALIIACELGFWVIVLLALAVRYVLGRDRLSRVLLFVTATDLRRGTTATFAHGLAAAYVGFTVAFGGMALKWADMHFAHRFAGGPAPAQTRFRLRCTAVPFRSCMESGNSMAAPSAATN